MCTYVLVNGLERHTPTCKYWRKRGVRNGTRGGNGWMLRSTLMFTVCTSVYLSYLFKCSYTSYVILIESKVTKRQTTLI